MRIDFSNKVRALRESHHLTQAELGRMLGVTKSVISAYETGLYFPRHDILVKLTKIFGVSMDSLYGMDAPEPEIQYVHPQIDLSNLSDEQIELLVLIIRQFSQVPKHDRSIPDA